MINALSGFIPRLCNRVNVWLYVPSGFFPIVVLSPPPESMTLVAPTVRLGSDPFLSLSESPNVRHSEHSSMMRASMTSPHSVQIKSPLE